MKNQIVEKLKLWGRAFLFAFGPVGGILLFDIFTGKFPPEYDYYKPIFITLSIVWFELERRKNENLST
jgi:hypothetical protein